MNLVLTKLLDSNLADTDLQAEAREIARGVKRSTMMGAVARGTRMELMIDALSMRQNVSVRGLDRVIDGIVLRARVEPELRDGLGRILASTYSLRELLVRQLNNMLLSVKPGAPLAPQNPSQRSAASK
jgi:hypothetical protein